MNQDGMALVLTSVQQSNFKTKFCASHSGTLSSHVKIYTADLPRAHNPLSVNVVYPCAIADLGSQNTCDGHDISGAHYLLFIRPVKVQVSWYILAAESGCEHTNIASVRRTCAYACASVCVRMCVCMCVMDACVMILVCDM